MRVPLRYGESYRLTAYARATSTLLVALISLAGFYTELLLYPALVLDLFIFYRALQAGLMRDEGADGSQPARELSIRTAPRDTADVRDAEYNEAATGTEPTAEAEKPENGEVYTPEAEGRSESHTAEAEGRSESHAAESGEAKDASLPDGKAEEEGEPTREDITPSDGWSF